MCQLLKPMKTLIEIVEFKAEVRVDLIGHLRAKKNIIITEYAAELIQFRGASFLHVLSRAR